MTVCDSSARIGIGGVTVSLHSADPSFLEMMEERYAGFSGSLDTPEFEQPKPRRAKSKSR